MAHGQSKPTGSRPRSVADGDKADTSGETYTGPPLRSKAALGRFLATARTLGASRLRVFFTITLPLAWPGLVTGSLLAFARALGEFGATITFVSNIPGETQTLPLAIYTFTQVPGGDAQALRLSILSVLLSLGALALSEWLVRREAPGTPRHA